MLSIPWFASPAVQPGDADDARRLGPNRSQLVLIQLMLMMRVLWDHARARLPRTGVPAEQRQILLMHAF